MDELYTQIDKTIAGECAGIMVWDAEIIDIADYIINIYNAKFISHRQFEDGEDFIYEINSIKYSIINNITSGVMIFGLYD